MNKYSKKLNEEKVMTILADTRSNRQVAKDYGVSHETIRKVRNRTNWGYVGMALCVARSPTCQPDKK